MSVAVTARLVNDRSGCFRRESASVHPAQQFEGDFAFARSPHNRYSLARNSRGLPRCPVLHCEDTNAFLSRLLQLLSQVIHRLSAIVVDPRVEWDPRIPLCPKLTHDRRFVWFPRAQEQTRRHDDIVTGHLGRTPNCWRPGQENSHPTQRRSCECPFRLGWNRIPHYPASLDRSPNSPRSSASEATNTCR